MMKLENTGRSRWKTFKAASFICENCCRRSPKRTFEGCSCEHCGHAAHGLQSELPHPGSSFRDLFGESAVVILLAVVALLPVLSGCDKKVPPELKTTISTASLAAKERAAAFGVIKGTIKAKDAAFQEELDALLASHGRGLNSQAAALNDFVIAIDANSAISPRGVDTIVEMSKNSKAWLEDITALRPHLKLTDAQEAWADTHIASLTMMSAKLAEFAETLKPTTPPKETSPPAEK